MSGAECCRNPPVLSSSSGSGSVIQLAGLKAYVSGSSHSKRAILLVSDGFGYESPNLRKIADKVATAGFYVVVPDFLHGEPFDPHNADQKPFPVWLNIHNTDRGFEDAKLVIDALKRQGTTTFGAAGFCWGAVKVPMAILGAGNDNHSPPELLRQFGEILISNQVKTFVKIYPGVEHGWAVRYQAEDEFAVKSAEEAQQDMLDWFLAHIS
uniref:Dienelactone hydrolase domain-containing protein n=1 Tax=Daucus carota subsp. sativus TaxID=79200 RepID=A0A162A2F4_DAUCS